MKILFGIQGTGNGHISRSRIMASHFSRLGVDVEYLFSGRPSEQLFDMEGFGDFHYRRGLTFSTHKGRVNYLASAWNNKFARFVHDVNQLDLSAFDLVLTDFEPVTAWAARQQSVPVLGIGHQYAFGGNTPMTGEIDRQCRRSSGLLQKLTNAIFNRTNSDYIYRFNNTIIKAK